MESDEAFAEYHHRIPVDLESVTKSEDVVLEQVDDVLCEAACISLSAFDS